VKVLKNVEIYTTQFCPFCIRAKQLLNLKSISFIEISVDHSTELRREMTKRSLGGVTVPQIFINGDPIGGSDELIALEKVGKLDELLSSED